MTWCWSVGLPLKDSCVDDHFSVLKPHGSLNWYVPIEGHYDKSACDDLRQGRSVIIALAESGVLSYLPYQPQPSGDLYGCEQFQLPSQLSGGVIGATMEMEPVIVTPRGAKRPDRKFLRDVRELEEAAIRGADEVYILGWSISRTDADQECFIRSMVGKRVKPFQHVTVVNFHADAEYYARVQDIFGVERAELRTAQRRISRVRLKRIATHLHALAAMLAAKRFAERSSSLLQMAGRLPCITFVPSQTALMALTPSTMTH